MKKLGFGFMRLPVLDANDASKVDFDQLCKMVDTFMERGFTYFDWNVTAGDASNAYTKQDILDNVLEGVSKYKTSVVLLHDDENKSTTVEALGTLIEKLKGQGAEILPIDEDTKVIQYMKAESIK